MSAGKKGVLPYASVLKGGHLNVRTELSKNHFCQRPVVNAFCFADFEYPSLSYRTKVIKMSRPLKTCPREAKQIAFNQHVIASGSLVQAVFTVSPVEYVRNCPEAVLDVQRVRLVFNFCKKGFFSFFFEGWFLCILFMKGRFWLFAIAKKPKENYRIAIAMCQKAWDKKMTRKKRWFSLLY